MTTKSSTLTPEQWRAIGERAEEATPGPWDHGGSTGHDDSEWVWERTHYAAGDPDAPDTRVCCASPADAAFIAACRDDVPLLVATCGALDAELAYDRELLNLIHSHVAEACEILGVDTSVESGQPADSWTLREHCQRVRNERDAAVKRANELEALDGRPDALDFVAKIGGFAPGETAGEAILRHFRVLEAERDDFEKGLKFSQGVVARRRDECEMLRRQLGHAEQSNAVYREELERIIADCEPGYEDKTTRAALDKGATLFVDPFTRAREAMIESEAKAMVAEEQLAAANAKLAEYEKAFATTNIVDMTRTQCRASEPGNAWDIIVKDRDEWKARASAAEAERDMLLRRDRVAELKCDLAAETSRREAAEERERKLREAVEGARSFLSEAGFPCCCGTDESPPGHTFDCPAKVGWWLEEPGALAPAPTAEPLRTIDVVFDGPPSHESGRFVEVEEAGRSVSVGEWIDRGDGYWALRFRTSTAPDAKEVKP